MTMTAQDLELRRANRAMRALRKLTLALMSYFHDPRTTITKADVEREIHAVEKRFGRFLAEMPESDRLEMVERVFLWASEELQVRHDVPLGLLPATSDEIGQIRRTS